MKILEYEEYKVKKEECDRLYEEVKPWIARFPAIGKLVDEASEELKAKHRRFLELAKEVDFYEDYHGLKY